MTPTRTDRSRIAAYQECPQLRWLKYHAGGMGYERDELNLNRAIGSAMHEVAAIALGGRDPEDYPVDLSAFDEEHKFMVTALAMLWVERRLPAILDEYDVVSVEEELIWHMTPDLDDMVRCDALLRRKADGALFLQEFKTARAFSPSWAAQFVYNTQIIANLQAMEEIRGERIEGVIVEGLLKSKWLTHGNDYGWPNDPHLRGRRGVAPFPAWERYNVDDWVHGAWWTDMDRDSLFNPLVAKRPTTALLKSWKLQIIAQEHRVARDVEYCERHPDATPILFPQYLDHCHKFAAHPCDMLDICHKGEVASDPIGSGLYVARVPHHAPERENESSTPSVLRSVN